MKKALLCRLAYIRLSCSHQYLVFFPFAVYFPLSSFQMNQVQRPFVSIVDIKEVPEVFCAIIQKLPFHPRNT